MTQERTKRFSLLPIIGTFCIVLCMASAAFYQLQCQRLDEEKNIGAYVARQASQALSLWLNDQLALARGLAQSPLIEKVCRNPSDSKARALASAYLNSVHGNHAEYTLIGFTSFLTPEEGIDVNDDEGNPHRILPAFSLVDSVGGRSLAVGGLDFNYIHAIYNGAPAFISEGKPNAIPGMPPTLVLAVPIKDGENIIGCLYMCIRLEHLSDSFSANMTFGRTGHMEAMDNRGLYIMHADKTKVLDTDGPSPPLDLLQNVYQGQQHFDVEEDDGMRMYTSVEVDTHHTMATRWWVLFRRDAKELYDDMAPLVIGMGMLFFLFFVLVAWLMRTIDTQAQRTLKAKALEDELKLHKNYQDTLQEERTILRSVLDNIQGIVFLRDRDSRYVTINSQFTHLMGMSLQDVQGKSDDELLPPEMAAFCRQTDSAACARKGPYYFEQSLPMPTGGMRDYLFSKEALYNENGQFNGILSVGIDVTLLKETQRQLVEAKGKAEEASKAKSAFLSTVSHEIRTPMNAIVGFVHLFDRDNLDTRQKDYLEKIRVASNNLLDIINNVLDISKIESGKLEIEHSPFRLDTLLHSLGSIAGTTAQAKGLRFVLEVDAATPETLVGDSTRVHQVLLNMVNNAVKFTTQGSVHLRVAPEANQPTLGKTVMGFTITDTGIGITQEQLERIFDPFMQADVSTTRKYGGTGLGLSICRELVGIMGGSIHVTSQEGQGTSFHVTLPLENTLAEPAVEDSPATSLSQCKAHVLLVDDNEINQEIALALLESMGLSVDVADDGVFALERVQERHYDLVLMDMQMPRMDGLESTRRMRALGKENTALAWLATVPIIAMTANSMLEDKKRCMEAGMDDHMGKPLDPQALCDNVTRWLQKAQDKPGAMPDNNA